MAHPLGTAALRGGRHAPSLLRSSAQTRHTNLRVCSRRSLTAAGGATRRGQAARCALDAADERPPPGQAVRGSCYGCGAGVQVGEPEAPGYVEPERYESKRRHRQLDQLLCRRCQQLSNGGMVPAVADAWARRQRLGSNERPLVSPQQLREQLAGIRQQRALVVLLVDLLDASGSFLGRVRDLVGRNPTVVVGTKADLLPKGTQARAVAAWLGAMAAAKRLNVLDTFALSSATGEGVPQAAAFIRRSRLGRDVYVVGAANVGKSAFTRALMREMSDMSSPQFDPAAAGIARRLPVASAMPGTTLQLIPLQAFHSGGVLFDTPGLHLPHRVPHMLTPEEAKQLHPRGRLRSHWPPSPADLTPPDRLSASATYLWGGLVQIDVLSAPSDCALVFQTPAALRVSALPLQPAAAALPEDAFGAGSTAAQGGLRVAKQAVLRPAAPGQALADVAVSGLPGWLSVYAAGRADVRLQVWAPAGIQAYVRPPLPCPDVQPRLSRRGSELLGV